MMRRPQKIRRPVVYALLGATGWFGAVLLAWESFGWPRALAVPIALAPFVAILLWSRGHPG